VAIDAVFAALEGNKYTGLTVEKAGIDVKESKIAVNDYLRTTTKMFIYAAMSLVLSILICGRAAGTHTVKQLFFTP
jgi:hypothetical protein